MINIQTLRYQVIEAQKSIAREIDIWEKQKNAVNKKLQELQYDLKIWLIILVSVIVPLFLRLINNIIISSGGGIADYTAWSILTMILLFCIVGWFCFLPMTLFFIIRSIIRLYLNRPTEETALLAPEEENTQSNRTSPYDQIPEPSYHHELAKLNWGLTKYYYYADELRKLQTQLEESETERVNLNKDNINEGDSLEQTIEKTLGSIKYYKRPFPAVPLYGAMEYKTSSFHKLEIVLSVIVALIYAIGLYVYLKSH